MFIVCIRRICIFKEVSQYKLSGDIIMRFSIITICYNEEKRIQTTLESVYRQSFKDYEHIIEDGGSWDNTISVCKQVQNEYEENQLKIFCECDNGLYDAMNRSLRRAEGDYICFLNSGDSLYDEHTLEKVNDEIEKTGYKDIYHGISISVFPNMDGIGQNDCKLESLDKCRMETIIGCGSLGLIHQAIFASKRCFVNNAFDTNYTLRAEYKWYYMCFSNAYSINKMYFPVCKYTFGGVSERLKSIKKSQEEKRAILKEFNYSLEQYDAGVRIYESNCVKDSLIYTQWLALLQAGHFIKDYFEKYGMKSIAIYGYAEYANHLINELKGTDINVLYLIDKRNLYPYAGVPVYRPEDNLPEADVVVVTAIISYEEIRDDLSRKLTCQIISLEQILEELWFIEPKNVEGTV